MSKERISATISFLENTGDHRVISRFIPADRYNEANRPADDAGLKVLMVVDTETTGLDKTKDKIIEIGYLLVEFDPKSGLVYRILEQESQFEDPGFPIPDVAKKITGIKDEDVTGQLFDDEKINAAIAKADVVIAHNAAFDRGFLEGRFPSFQDKWWACSMRTGPWEEMGISSTKQEFIAYAAARIFYEAHRALTDAQVLLHILTMAGPGEQPILASVLKASKVPTYRIWALGSPFEKKDCLKALHYKWNDVGSTDAPAKTWYVDSVVDVEAQLASLRADVYANGNGTVIVEKITGRERYTSRCQRREDVSLSIGQSVPH